MLKVSKVGKYFANQKVVDDISFSIKKGEIVGLLGPNGAGKTTTMRMIASYFYPDEGKITLDNDDTFKKTLTTQRKIGYMPENNPLYLDMLAYDFLEMTLSIVEPTLKNDQKMKVIKTFADKVHLREKLGKPISELSKGYKQRVGLVAALLGDPELLILDEPTEGLDPIEREEIRNLIRSLGQNRAVLISSHVLQEIKAVCDRVIIVNEGKVIIDGDPNKLTDSFSYRLTIEGEGIKPELEKLAMRYKGTVKIEDGKAKLKKVIVTSNSEISPQISNLAAKNKWTIWELSAVDQLETVFKEIK